MVLVSYKTSSLASLTIFTKLFKKNTVSFNGIAVSNAIIITFKRLDSRYDGCSLGIFKKHQRILTSSGSLVEKEGDEAEEDSDQLPAHLAEYSFFGGVARVEGDSLPFQWAPDRGDVGELLLLPLFTLGSYPQHFWRNLYLFRFLHFEYLFSSVLEFFIYFSPVTV